MEFTKIAPVIIHLVDCGTRHDTMNGDEGDGRGQLKEHSLMLDKEKTKRRLREEKEKTKRREGEDKEKTEIVRTAVDSNSCRLCKRCRRAGFRCRIISIATKVNSYSMYLSFTFPQMS